MIILTWVCTGAWVVICFAGCFDEYGNGYVIIMICMMIDMIPLTFSAWWYYNHFKYKNA